MANDGDRESFLAKLGPGLITGASDDDPSGIATYSQIGAKFGYGQLWTMVFSYPLMTAIQEISARVGRVSGRGIAGNMRRHYPAWIMRFCVLLLVLANVLNIGADLSAMGDALNLIVPGPTLIYCSVFAIGSALLQVFVPYHRYVKVLKYLTLVLLAYIATAFAIKIDWSAAVYGTFIPSSISTQTVVALTAVFGTTISPYLFFWQASEEVEEIHVNEADQPLRDAPEQSPEQHRRIRFDTLIGMGASNLIAWFIMLVVAATLHSKGIHDIDSSTKAAEALRPIAGPLAFLLFSVGIIGTGLLAVPVLAGSAAYAVGEALHWKVGLERKPLHARGFYGIIVASMLVGLALVFLKINPMKALFWSAVANGIAAGPIMVMLMLMSSNASVMGRFVIGPRLRFLGWVSTAVMLACGIGTFVFWGQ
jgi:NRAMP (natural resistance-associated macrophage protein)-like metal ion transporter